MSASLNGGSNSRGRSRHNLMSRSASLAEAAAGTSPAIAGNDETVRDQIWKRYEGNEWAAYEALPSSIRRQLHEHAYDAWSVNALMLWQRYRRLHPTGERAERALLRYLDFCERLERRAYANMYAEQYGSSFPHEAAKVDVLRYADALSPTS